MYKDAIFEVDNVFYKIRKVVDKGVYASKMVDNYRCQKGRPSKFTFELIAEKFDTTVQDLKEASGLIKKKLARPAESVEDDDLDYENIAPAKPAKPEFVKPILTPEELEARKKCVEALFELIDDKSTTLDW